MRNYEFVICRSHLKEVNPKWGGGGTQLERGAK